MYTLDGPGRKDEEGRCVEITSASRKLKLLVRVLRLHPAPCLSKTKYSVLLDSIEYSVPSLHL